MQELQREYEKKWTKGRAKMSKTGNEKLIEQLLADGCHYMFGNPGTVEQGFLDAIRKYPDFHYISCLQESIAVAMADGYARKTERPAIVQLHSGVGLGNGIGMLYQALRGHSPLIVLAGEAGIQYDAMDAQMACDLVEMAKTVTKWSKRVVHKDSVLRMLRRAIKIAMTPPMGPVFLCLPLDVLDEINTEDVVPSVQIQTKVLLADESIVNKAADLLRNAKNPLFLIGDGVSFSHAREAVQDLASIIGAKVYGVDNSLVNFDRSLPCYYGDLGHMFGTSSMDKVKDADVVLIVGTYVFPEVFPSLESPFMEQAKIIHIDLDTYEIGKNFPVTLGIASDPAVTLELIYSSVKQRQNPVQKEEAYLRRSQMEADKEKREANFKEDNIICTFLRGLKEMTNNHVTLFDESLTSSNYLNHYFPQNEDGTFFQTRGGSLGVGIPGALGIKLASPNELVIAFTGDGGSMYTIQALQTASRYHIGAKFVILNNGEYKLLKQNMSEYWKTKDIKEHEYPDCFELHPYVDFVKLAESMHIKGRRVTQEGEIEEALQWFLTEEESVLIELVVS